MNEATNDLLTALNPLAHPVCLVEPRYTPFSAWLEHIPFAMYLIDVLRPRTFVELGSHYGASYCAFCQAVLGLSLDTRCFAVDTWKGDAHAGHYGPDVLAELRAHHDPLYGEFSRLIESTFDEALEHFDDHSVDLLHIDGYHTYEAVKHDYTSWLPKMSSRGVVVFHDINVRERDFGVRRFWEEVRGPHPSFEMLHGHGLGVLAVGEVHSREFRALLNAKGTEAAAVRRFFHALGQPLQLRRRELPHLSARLAAVEGLARHREQEIQRLSAELAQAGQSLQVGQAELAELRTNLAQANELTRQRDAELARANELARQRDAELAWADDLARQRDAELEQAAQTLHARDADLARADEAARQNAAELAGCADRISSLRAELSQAAALTRGQEAELAELRDGLALAHELVCQCGHEFSTLASRFAAGPDRSLAVGNNPVAGGVVEATCLLSQYEEAFHHFGNVLERCETAFARGPSQSPASRAAA